VTYYGWMQPLAITAIVVAVIMIIGVSVTLIRVRRGAAGRWNRHGTVPLAAAGLALGAITRIGSGQTSATHTVLFTVTTVLLLGALVCALVGATAAIGRRPSRDQA
jgi:hypothetical protein